MALGCGPFGRQPQQTQPANASVAESAMRPPSSMAPLLPPLLLALLPLLLPPLLEPPPSAVGDGAGVFESEHAACAASDTPRMTTVWKSFEVCINQK
jgi:hypothetical protein